MPDPIPIASVAVGNIVKLTDMPDAIIEQATKTLTGILSAAAGSVVTIELNNRSSLSANLLDCYPGMNLFLENITHICPEGDHRTKIPDGYVNEKDYCYVRIPEEVLTYYNVHQKRRITVGAERVPPWQVDEKERVASEPVNQQRRSSEKLDEQMTSPSNHVAGQNVPSKPTGRQRQPLKTVHEQRVASYPAEMAEQNGHREWPSTQEHQIGTLGRMSSTGWRISARVLPGMKNVYTEHVPLHPDFRWSR